MKKQSTVNYKSRIETMRLCRTATSKEVLDILNVPAVTKTKTNAKEKNYVPV